MMAHLKWCLDAPSPHQLKKKKSGSVHTQCVLKEAFVVIGLHMVDFDDSHVEKNFLIALLAW